MSTNQSSLGNYLRRRSVASVFRGIFCDAAIGYILTDGDVRTTVDRSDIHYSFLFNYGLNKLVLRWLRPCITLCNICVHR
jgi:hypothetical protein